MSQDNKNTNSTKIFALGGIEEIGRNCYIIEHQDELWIIDYGNKFIDKRIYPGFNCLIPCFDYLVKNQNKIRGLIVTHAHEDHIGGIPFLLKNVAIPVIYTGKLTHQIIQKKLLEHPDVKQPHFVIINDDTIVASLENKTKFDVYFREKVDLANVIESHSKEFIIDFFRVCHSVPDAFGVCLKTPNGIIVSTGDFRFDFVTAGDETDIVKLSKIGLREPDVLLCESTNALTPGFSISEKHVIEELRRIIFRTKGRIIITIFASNLYRIEEIISLAIMAKRKILILGRSMVNNVEASMRAKILNIDQSWLISVNDVDNYKSNEILILTTGTQGEELAALNKMATNTHQKIKLNEDDYVIFSSNPIPGNFESVELLINNLAKTGAHVFISNKESKIHSSGHATQTELELMIKLVNPLYLMPIHGEFKMLTSLCREGNNLNIPPERLILTKNGRIVELNNHRLSITDELVPTNDVFIEGKNIVSDRGSNVISTRQILGQEGIISITVLVDQTKKTVINSPIIIVRGTFRSIDSKELIDALSNSVKNNVNSFLAQTNEFALDKIKNIINKTILLLVEKYKYKKPYITSTVFLTN